MLKPVMELEKILLEEQRIYEEIYSIEEEKRDIIIERDGRTLDKLCLKQEDLATKISRLEKKRSAEIESYRKINRLDDRSREVTLKEIAFAMDKDSSARLIKIGMDLRNIIEKITAKQKLNEQLISDNLEFFNLLLSGLKSGVSMDMGYGKNGKEESKISRPMIFNKTA